MNSHIVADLAIILGFACYICFPFGRKRIRARWAKFIFILSGVIGIFKGVIGLMLDAGWLNLSGQSSHFVRSVLMFIGGLLLGFIFSLILAGQLLGSKAPTEAPGHAPRA